MRRLITILILIFSFVFVLTGKLVAEVGIASADWWSRDDRPVAPTIARDRLPTQAPEPTWPPTSPPQPTTPSQATPTVTPRIGGPPTATPTLFPSATPGGGGGGGTAEDPCASGKSYTGPYCGWSPGVGGGGEEIVRVGEPEVLGLSATSGEDLTLSDIMLLVGALCLLLYTRSKVSISAR